jgi:hypothetical protein
MIQKLLFVFCLIAILSLGTWAQARRTVTNADLERYKQTRIVAERELREDYVRLGFPSPEVRERRDAESRQQMFDLSARLKAERLESERQEYERQQRLAQAFATPLPYRDIGSGEYFWPTQWYYNSRGARGNLRRAPQQQGYFAGGQFWPTGPRTPAEPMIRIRPRH